MTNSRISKSGSEKPGAIFLLVITSILWSSGGLLIKSIDTNPLAIAGARSAIASIIILLALRKPKFNWSLPQIAAALSYTGTVILFVTANKMTTAANAILLQFTAPIYVALLGAWLLKEKAKLFDWLTIIAVFGGMFLFFFDDLNAKGMIGNLVAIASGVTFALFTIFMRMQKDGSPMESILLGNIFAAVIGLPFLYKATPDSKGCLCLVILGVFQLGISYVLYSKSIKHLTALETIIISGIEPVLNPIWVFLLIGEVPGPLALIGGGIVFVMVTIKCVLSALSEDSPVMKRFRYSFKEAGKR